MRSINLMLLLIVCAALNGCLSSASPFYTRADGVLPVKGSYGLFDAAAEKDKFIIAKQVGTYYTLAPELYREAILVPLPSVNGFFVLQHFYESKLMYSLVSFEYGANPQSRRMKLYGFATKPVLEALGIELELDSDNILLSRVESRSQLEAIFRKFYVMMVEGDLPENKLGIRTYNIFNLTNASEYKAFTNIE